MKRIFIFFFLIALIAGKNGYASGNDVAESLPVSEGDDVTAEETYVFPVLKPQVFLFTGYRFVGLSGDARVEEFEYLHSSPVLGGEVRVFSFPNRFHLDLDIKDKKDYFADVSYAYQDLVLFRAINRTLWHNLENITLMGVSSPGAGVNVLDKGVNYGVKTGISNVFLRFKTPDFPFHIYLDGGFIERDGTQQLRSLLGSGYFNNIVRTSQSRDVDWHTKFITLGANSHLGPVEMDYSHGEKRFDSGGNNVFYDYYTAAAEGTTIIRNAGLFPHNLVPDLKGSSDTVKLHTSYTGSLVASATFSRIQKDNRDSGANVDYFIGAGEVTWIATPRLAFFVHYRHRDSDVNNQGEVAFANVCASSNNPSNTYSCLIKSSISSSIDKVSGTMRYRLLKGVVLRAEVSYENIDRKNAEEWFVPSSTTKETASLTADIRLIKTATMSAKYIHKNIDNPETNVEPDSSDEGRITFSWVPFPGLTTLLSYRLAKEKRNTLDFVHEDPLTSAEVLIEGPDGRDVTRNRLLGSVTYLALDNVALTASYSYIHDKVRQDIAYADLSGNALFDEGVPASVTANTYSLDASYMPRTNLTLSAGASYTLSSGGFSPTDPNLTQPVSIASFSELRTRETIFSVSADYRFKNGFSLGVQYRYDLFDDALDNPFDDVKDGKSHIVLLTLSKRW